jgi:hypothetical protein
MSIRGVGGIGRIFDHGSHNPDQFSDDSSEAEQLIFEFLLQHFKLTDQQSRNTIIALVDAGENLFILAQGVDISDDAVIRKIESYIP